MDTKKLFHALVMGGALLAAGCESEDAADGGGGQPDDATAPVADGGVAPSDVDAAPPMECGFCPNEACCETAEDGTAREREGLVCCWGTSC